MGQISHAQNANLKIAFLHGGLLRDKTQTNQAWLLTGSEICSFASHTEILFSEYIALVCHLKQWQPVKRETCKKGELGYSLAKQGFKIW